MTFRSWSSMLLSGLLAFSLSSCGGGGGDADGTLDPDAGTLDTSFGVGGNGVAVTDPGSVDLHNVIRAIAIDSSDRIVAVGYQESAGSDRDFLVMRFTADGEVDTSFGADGSITTSFGTTDEEAYSVAIQADGRIVVVGEEYNFGHPRFAMARYLANGDLDPDFSTDGKLTQQIQNGSGARALAIRGDGKIVIGGWANLLAAPNPFVFALTRLTSAGVVDGGFGTAGYTLTAIGSSHDRIQALTLQTDGKIVAAGYSYNGSKNVFAVARYSGDGVPDTTFSGDGMLTTDMNAGASEANAVDLDGSRIVVGGYAINGFTRDFAVARYTSSGALDTSFNVSGKVTTDFTTGQEDLIYALTVDADHRIVAAGTTVQGVSGTSSFDLALARYNENGTLDTSMSGDGKLAIDVNGDDEQAYSVALQGSKAKIVLGGYATSGTGDKDVLLARIWP